MIFLNLKKVSFSLFYRKKFTFLLKIPPDFENPLLSKGGKGGWREVWREVFPIPTKK